MRAQVPPGPGIIFSLAYRTIGRSADADAILAELAKSQAGPISAYVQFLVGQSLLEAGKYTEAIAPLEGYLAANPRGDVAEFAIAHLVMARLGLGELDAAWKMLDRLNAGVFRQQELTAGTGRARRRRRPRLIKSVRYRAVQAGDWGREGGDGRRFADPGQARKTRPPEPFRREPTEVGQSIRRAW